MVYSVKETHREPPAVLDTITSRLQLSAALWDQVEAGVRLLRSEEVIAYPTDTLYGLGADFASEAALQRVLEIKGRPQQMGIPLLLSGPDQLSLVADGMTDAALALARRFWPGALTLVVRRSSAVSDLVTGGRDTVAVRVPNHAIPRALAAGLGRPITGTSANLTGAPPATTAEEVRRQLGDRVALVIDGGPSPLSQASTIVDVSGPVLRLVRTGAVSLEAIRNVHPGMIEA